MMKRLAPLGFLAASTALATTLIAADVPALARSADAIVIGTVVSSNPRLSADGFRIVTDTEISVTEALKGQTVATLVVTEPGGIVGNLGQKVEGTATFEVGEEVVVFLDKRSDRFRVTGMLQGKFRLERSSDGRTRYAIPQAVLQTRLVDPVTHQETVSALKSVELQLFKAQIAAALKGPLRTEPATWPALKAVP